MDMRNGRRCIATIAVLVVCAVAMGATRIPLVKQAKASPGEVDLSGSRISTDDERLANEVAFLREELAGCGIELDGDGPVIRLEIASVDFPTMSSKYADEIRDQGYRLRIDKTGGLIEGRTPAGVFNGVQTLLQMVGETRHAPLVEILDWPDLAFRGVMVDPARANENAEYYERLIRFCARHKINRIHIHLTDDQNVCLYHEDYEPLMHPHAWRPEQRKPPVDLAQRLHIELIPEIESLGHARVFLRHPDFREILHQTTSDKPAGSWAGTEVHGFTNVLCPASDKTYEYLDAMYARAAEVFPHPRLHIGCDEVDMTECGRCAAEFPGISTEDWFLKHLLRCRDIAARHNRQIGLWGDMLLSHRGIVEKLPTTGVVIYDWHYRADVSDESVAFFKRRGFEVIGCPALMCHPHMILPAEASYENVRRFAEIARRHDLHGIDTTIWIPTRYMSDVLWPGIAYAAGQSWSGSHWDEEAFYDVFAADFFGLPDGKEFTDAYRAVQRVDWPVKTFNLACWASDEELARAKQTLADGAARQCVERSLGLGNTLDRLKHLREHVTKHQVEWDAIQWSLATLMYTQLHFIVSDRMGQDDASDRMWLGMLDVWCTEILDRIEADWDRNRFADDPGKDDITHLNQHLLDRFRRMHEYHQRKLKELEPQP
ncbi:MAG: beta-N-acetylhexosaminidase [Phycisphaerae bacterium]|nr:beta-N-acetylhexosaminidase [Phycisphaerae bacterium]